MAPFWSSRNNKYWSSSSLNVSTSTTCSNDEPEEQEGFVVTSNKSPILDHTQNPAEEVDEEREEEEDPWSPDNVAAVRDLWKLTDREMSSLLQLHVLLQDVDHWKNDSFEV